MVGAMETETPIITVLDASQRHNLPTGHVAVTAPAGATDRDLADAAGYCSRHWGYAVTRWPLTGTATVHLHND
jgi:hypothetical protein